jgi:hypothetical protein
MILPTPPWKEMYSRLSQVKFSHCHTHTHTVKSEWYDLVSSKCMIASSTKPLYDSSTHTTVACIHYTTTLHYTTLHYMHSHWPVHMAKYTDINVQHSWLHRLHRNRSVQRTHSLTHSLTHSISVLHSLYCHYTTLHYTTLYYRGK